MELAGPRGAVRRGPGGSDMAICVKLPSVLLYLGKC